MNTAEENRKRKIYFLFTAANSFANLIILFLHSICLDSCFPDVNFNFHYIKLVSDLRSATENHDDMSKVSQRGKEVSLIQLLAHSQRSHRKVSQI